MKLFRENAKFEKVSFNQYVVDWKKLFNEEKPDLKILRDIYDNIQLPKRGTKESAGYDFITPFSFKLSRDSSIVFPTGIRCKMRNDSVLALFPRSGQGFKYRLSIANTVGIIDSDYYNADNEGHILIKLVYDGFEKMDSINTIKGNCVKTQNEYYFNPISSVIANGSHVLFEANKGVAQGVILKYYTAKEETTDYKKRTGGFGSTDK